MMAVQAIGGENARAALGRQNRDVDQWRWMLSQIPTWLVEQEARARRFEEHSGVVRVGWLVVDPGNHRIEYRGRAYMVTGRQMDILHTLAQARLQGHRRVEGFVLAELIWRDFGRDLAHDNLMATVHLLRRRVPGLLLMSGRARKLGYGLAVDPGDEAVA